MVPERWHTCVWIWWEETEPPVLPQVHTPVYAQGLPLMSECILSERRNITEVLIYAYFSLGIECVPHPDPPLFQGH